MSALPRGDLFSPTDYAAIAGEPGWRDRLAWPLPLKKAYRLGRERLTAVALGVAGMPAGDARDIAAAAAGRSFIATLPLLEQAYGIAAEGAYGTRIFGIAEADYLRGIAEQPGPRGFPTYLHLEVPRWPAARAMARMRSWTPWHRMPSAWFIPEAVAITHNELMREVARQDGVALGFHHAETLYASVPRGGGLSEQASEAAVATLLDAMTAGLDLDAGMAARLRWLVEHQIRVIIDRASVDLAAMRQVRRLPKRIWAGSGGHWPARVLALEAMRRGATITRFDHGQNRALHDICEFPALIDLLVGHELVAPTEGIAKQIDRPMLRRFLPQGHIVQVSGRRYSSDMMGYLSADRAARSKAARMSGRPRVLYAPNVLRGQRQTVPANLPDMVYLDWQFRLVEALMPTAIELLLRPHPQGIFAGMPHPLAVLHPIQTEPFEQIAPTADVFLFDSPYSRVFCKALVTDRPIVYIDFGTPYFAPEVENLIRQRCVWLDAISDDRNRPSLSWSDLVAALVAPPSPDEAAVAAFRELLIGRE